MRDIVATIQAEQDEIIIGGLLDPELLAQGGSQQQAGVGGG